MKFATRLKLWIAGGSLATLGAWALFRAPKSHLSALRARAAVERARALPLPHYVGPPKNNADRQTRVTALSKARPDASQYEADGYFDGQIYYLVSQSATGEWVYSGAVTRSGGPDLQALGYRIDGSGASGRPVDVYGRDVHGQSPNPLGTLLGAAQIALPWVPGVGPAASAALAAAIAIGKGKSLKDAALSAARAAVPGGPAGQIAFDLGVAVASGERVDSAAAVALIDKLPSGDTAFELGARAVLSSEQQESVRRVRGGI